MLYSIPIKIVVHNVIKLFKLRFWVKIVLIHSIFM